jgi:hypothetical protein
VIEIKHKVRHRQHGVFTCLKKRRRKGKKKKKKKQ